MTTPNIVSPTHKVADAAEPREVTVPSPEAGAERASVYVPRILQQHLVDDPAGRCWTDDGSAAFVDISGFTQLAEQLARKGREGAEQITDVIGASFESILQSAYDNGASLLKFGGDALLLWFDGEGHPAHACRAAVLMRQVLHDVGRIELPDAKVTLQMSQGVHSGRFHFFAVGTSHLELLTTGPAWSRLVAMEHGADADEIVVSAETAAVLPSECRGDAKGPGLLLRGGPGGDSEKMPLRPRPRTQFETLAHCLPPAIRAHIAGGGEIPEHRRVTIAFIRFAGTDALIEQKGADVTAEALHRLLSTVDAAAEEQGVAFLASDVDADGGKLILCAGAPKSTGNDEERMLLALRKIADSEFPIPIQVGVHRGSAFAGDIGPKYRRTYTVMGDAVNLTARLMAKAEPGLIYATADVLDRSNTLFETTRLEPFAVKGKADPVQAWSVGRAQSSKTRQVSLQRLSLTGRNAELDVVREAFTSARLGAGRLIEVVGETGIGKTRLLEALRDAATGFRKLHAACEAYTASTPYALWSELLRELMEFGRDDPDAAISERLRVEVTTRVPHLAPWLPLIAVAFGLEIEPTPEVAMLAENNRRAKLHESVSRFLAVMMPEPQLIEIENAHHMDEASAELLSYLTTRELEGRPWLFAVARRPSSGGFMASDAPAVVRVELKPLAPQDTLRLAQLATEQSALHAHVLEVVVKRSGGNPQFLRDLLRTAIVSGGVADLPDSAEAAAMAQIDALAPEDRAVVRRAAVFGITFHPRMLLWFAEVGDAPSPAPATWPRLQDFFDEEPDGYLRFRRSLLRDAAYEGLPFKLRRKLHGSVAAHLEEETDHPEDVAGILSLHYFEAGEHQPAWQYATAAAKRAEGAYAYVEAAALYSRALEAGHRLENVGGQELAAVQQALGDSWYRAGEFAKASKAYTAARAPVASDPLVDAELLLKLSHVEAKLGQCEQALRWTEQARTALQGVEGVVAARQSARAGAWYAMVLQTEGRTTEALEWAERTVAEAEAVDDADALADAYFVMGWAYGELGKEGGLTFMQRSLEAYKRSGNLARQADVLSTLGVVCQWEGRWDEALSYYERGRDDAVNIGDTVGAALARTNVAEILTDRGEWAEAEALLLETLPLWKASQYRYYLGACLWFLGRVLLRLGRLDEALSRLEEARSNFLQVGAEEVVPAVDAWIAECRVAMGNADAALELARGLLGRASESNGVARVVPLLERVQAHALLLRGDLRGARDALEASLAAAKERHDLYETILTQLSLIELDRLEGVETPLEIVTESRSLLASLKIRAVPPVPTPPQ
jgi:class 3 adenylate cyclase/tetratricopeptide (TPR) repeat protein